MTPNHPQAPDHVGVGQHRRPHRRSRPAGSTADRHAAAVLPADSHVHSEWSWDAPLGSMERSCAQAVEYGLPAIAFTEHLDHTSWTVVREDGVRPDEHLASLASPDGLLAPPKFDAVRYLAAIEHCRDRFPSLRVLSGLEIGEPHWHADAVAAVLAAGRFDRLLGSLHCLPTEDGFTEPPGPGHYRLPRRGSHSRGSRLPPRAEPRRTLAACGLTRA